MTTVVASLSLLLLSWAIVWWANRPEPDRLRITRERRRMQIEHDRHARE
jgi:hypothetical protein